MDRLDRLSREYREIAPRYRETHDPGDGRRLRELRAEIRELVAAERLFGRRQIRARSINGPARRARREAERERRAQARAEQLVAEWERWRYRRSRLPPDERGVVLRPGERECAYCGSAFVPNTLRQRHCKTYKPGNPNYCRQMDHKAKGPGTRVHE